MVEKALTLKILELVRQVEHVARIAHTLAAADPAAAAEHLVEGIEELRADLLRLRTG
jgi:hypothetical protein